MKKVLLLLAATTTIGLFSCNKDDDDAFDGVDIPREVSDHSRQNYVDAVKGADNVKGLVFETKADPEFYVYGVSFYDDYTVDTIEWNEEVERYVATNSEYYPGLIKANWLGWTMSIRAYTYKYRTTSPDVIENGATFTYYIYNNTMYSYNYYSIYHFFSGWFVDNNIRFTFTSNELYGNWSSSTTIKRTYYKTNRR